MSLSGNSSQTINPGHLQPDHRLGQRQADPEPGIYIIAGGGFTVSGNASVAVSGPTSSLTGTGVMIYNAGSKLPQHRGGTYGAITLSGNGTYQPDPAHHRDLCRHPDLPVRATTPRP